LKGAFQCIAPSGRNRLEIGIVLFDPLALRDRETVGFINLHVQRQIHCQIGANRRIEGNQQQFHRIFERHVRIEGTDQNRTTIFGFATLEKGTVIAGFDEIAGRIDQEKSRIAAVDLSANNQGCPKGRLGFLAVVGIGLDHFAQGFANDRRDLKHGWCLQDRRIAVVGMLAAFVQQADNCLRGRKIARRQQRDHAISLDFPTGQLLDLGNIVHTGIGPGIRHENKAAFHPQAYTIGHFFSPELA